jgi:hypothetical protein
LNMSKGHQKSFSLGQTDTTGGYDSHEPQDFRRPRLGDKEEPVLGKETALHWDGTGRVRSKIQEQPGEVNGVLEANST